MSLLQQSLSALKATPVSVIPLAELQSHYRNIAMGFNQEFSKFAVSICGCETPSDRVKLKKAVWFQTTGLRLKSFETDSNRPFLKTLAQMECAVQILPKSSSSSRDESSPSKIILASKLLRSHFDLNESTSCRGCSKRGRCPFARKVVTNKSAKTSLGAVTKILYGMSQSCRLYLKDPEVYPFVMSVNEVEAGLRLTEELSKFLEPSALERQLRNVPKADRNAVRAIVKHQLKKNQELEQVRKKATPEWLGLEPVNSGIADDSSQEKSNHFDIDGDDWVPEENGGELSKSNLKFSNIDSTPTASGNMLPIDSIRDIPIPERFTESKKGVEKRRETHIFKPSFIKSSSLEPSGGYKTEEALTPHGGVEYIKPHFLKGKTVLDNVSLATKLWSGASPYITELKFLQRIPFQDKVEPSIAPVDPILAKVLAKDLPVTERTESAKSVVSEDVHFDMWKRRRAVKVLLLDKRVDIQGARGNEALDLRKMEIASLPSVSVPLKDKPLIGHETAEAVRTATAGDEPRAPQLRFPKLPQWDESRKVPISKTAVDGLKEDYSKLMRPVRLDAKTEQRRSEKAIKKAAANRRVKLTTPAEAAKVW